MKIYLLVDGGMTGKTTLLKKLGYTFCDDNGGPFSYLNKLIASGEKRIAIDDYMNLGSADITLKDMYEGSGVVCEQKYKDPVYITADKYQDVEIVLSTDPRYVSNIGLGMLAKCQKVSVKEFKKIKGIM